MKSPKQQKIGIYWRKDFANVLETWGEKTVWKELPLLLASAQGRVLDIGCGVGRTIEILARVLPQLEVHGCDIAGLLINQAIGRGITRERLKICDMTENDYADDQFDYSYSIGSFEHFTEDGIARLIEECHRITKRTSYHQIPISKSGKDEGWVTTELQDYFDNTPEWWLNKFRTVYDTVLVLDSTWECKAQYGKWFICQR